MWRDQNNHRRLPLSSPVGSNSVSAFILLVLCLGSLSWRSCTDLLQATADTQPHVVQQHCPCLQGAHCLSWMILLSGSFSETPGGFWRSEVGGLVVGGVGGCGGGAYCETETTAWLLLYMQTCWLNDLWHPQGLSPSLFSLSLPLSLCLSLPLWEEEVDPLGYRFAALCWEQPLLFGDVEHGLGHLVQRRLLRLQTLRGEGVSRTQLDVPIFQGQEGHEEVYQVAGHELTLRKPTCWREIIVIITGKWAQWVWSYICVYII